MHIKWTTNKVDVLIMYMILPSFCEGLSMSGSMQSPYGCGRRVISIYRIEQDPNQLSTFLVAKAHIKISSTDFLSIHFDLSEANRRGVAGREADSLILGEGHLSL